MYAMREHTPQFKGKDDSTQLAWLQGDRKLTLLELSTTISC